MATQMARLVKLDESDLTVADPAQDIRGRKVVDKYGEEIGRIDSLYIDEGERHVRFLEVGSGGFLGIGGETRLIPVDAITRVEGDEVFVDETRERVHDSPRYDPELTEDREYWNNLYGYYGRAPFWGPGYTYPRYYG